MVNEINGNLIYNKKSIYRDLKEFHDRNQGELYSYQDFQVAGLKEFKSITNKVKTLQEYEKNRLASELMKIFIDVNSSDDISNIDGYVTLNPAINYYESIFRLFKVLIRSDKEIMKKLSFIITKILLESCSDETIKLGLILAPICNVGKLEEILDVFSIHNEYIFYVVMAYEYIGKNNNYIFQLSKRSKGYGRLFCIRVLQPTTNEIKKWMIEEGSDNDVAVTELIGYSMLSQDLLDYFENTKFDKAEIDKISKSFSMLLSDYGLDDIKDGLKVCCKLLKIIDQCPGGIYSLYSVISILYSIETIIVEYDIEDKSRNLSKYMDTYNDIIKYCKEICKKKMWYEIIKNEVYNIEIESSVLISSAEKTGYKLKKKEFEMILNRDSTNPLIYKYAFSIGNKAIKRYAFNFALKKLPMDKMLCGQDELTIDNLEYDDIEHICFFIIIKYSKYEEFKEEYKEVNLEALRSPLIETRNQAILNLLKLKKEFNSLDEEIINDAINSEIVDNIRIGLNSLITKLDKKEKKYVDVSKYRNFGIHVKDIYLNSIQVTGTNYIDMSEIFDKLLENDTVFLIKESNNLNGEKRIQVVTTQGYVIGYIPKEDNVVLNNLINNGKYIYGSIKEMTNNYEYIKIDLYLSYKDVIDEITTTLSLLSRTKEEYIQ
ncbi:HIRAN domain-containing protein [Clostridium saccharobutylicum]|uniref:HIRAN domain protein n=1 Tax=Clostridium saccharobutylicum TaxID=169679 RepID=A0A1S8MYL6_CLOSA|nr:HIRAN domain-containing protein [Clostridium saccharobutylicum]OOM09264.1 HIRAN domain protein [Clostridium saccharobutylicum]